MRVKMLEGESGLLQAAPARRHAPLPPNPHGNGRLRRSTSWQRQEKGQPPLAAPEAGAPSHATRTTSPRSCLCTSEMPAESNRSRRSSASKLEFARPPDNDEKRGTSWTQDEVALDVTRPSPSPSRPPPRTRAQCTGVSTTAREQQRGASSPQRQLRLRQPLPLQDGAVRRPGPKRPHPHRLHRKESAP